MLRFLALVAVLMLAPAALAAPDAVADRNAFLDAYRCHVVAALDALRADAKLEADKRFVLLARRDRRQAYVQCNQAFPDAVTCQASTGLAGPRFDEAGTMQLGNEQRQKLERLGFAWRMDSLNLILELGTPLPQPDQIADLMLKAMFDGYGVRLGDRLTLIAPIQQDRPARLDRCPGTIVPQAPSPSLR